MAADVVSGTIFVDPHDAIILGRECRTLLADHGPCGIYPRWLRSYVRDFNAFPGVLSEVVPTPYFTPEQTVRTCYSHRTLVHFAAFLGLAEVEPTTKEPYDRLYRVRKRPLLAEAVRFHIPG